MDSENKILRDVTRGQTKTIPTYSKEELRSYLKNIGNSEKNLRYLSRFLYYRSNIYSRLISFYSNMFDLRCRKVVPKYDLVKGNDNSKVLKQYQDTLDALAIMNLQDNMIGILERCFIEDVCYALYFHDDNGSFFYILDPDMCKIDRRYMTGDFGFSIDMSKWSSRTKQEQLIALGEPLTTMYEEYQRTGEKWVPCPDEYNACFKFRVDDWETVIPPFIALFMSLINLEDLADVQAIADEQQIYKLVYLPIDTITGASTMDEFKVNPDTAIEYFNRLLQDALPEYISGAVIPGDSLKTIEFDDNAANDTNRIENAQTTILNTSGGGMVLNTSKITTQAGFEAALKCETEFAVSTLIPQINAWTNRMLQLELGSDHAKVEHFEVSVYTKELLRKSLLESCQYSFSNRLAYNTLNGISEKDTLAMNYLEEEVLGLHNIMKYPLQSSYTTSSEIGQGAPEKDSDEKISG